MTDSTESTSNVGFPWFEERNYSGWFIQFKAHLRRTDSLAPLENPRPVAPIDAQGVPVVMNAAQSRALLANQAAYDKADNIAFSELMKACRRNPKTKSLTESGDFNGAFPLITRLKARYNNVDEVMKASHLLKYHSLAQQESESGADYVQREQHQYLALKAMGVNVSDSLRLTKFIQDKTTNSQHHVLAQTIYSTPQMTLSRATSLFEGYQPADTSTVETPTVNAVTDMCNYCKKPGHLVSDCRRLKAKNRERSPPRDRDRRGRRDGRGGDRRGERRRDPPKKPRYPCGICESPEHSAYQCPLKKDVRKCVQQLKSKKGANWGNDEPDDDEDNRS
jgi:hypothetical protein